MEKSNQRGQIITNKSQIKRISTDSETNVTSKKGFNSLNNTKENETEKIQKKSIDFFPKKKYAEEFDDSIKFNRKYTAENELIIKGFAPQLKPIEIHVVPSKLRLNKKNLKDIKRNKNIIFVNSNHYYISCPSSEEDESDIFISSKENININSGNNSKIFFFEDNKNISINKFRKNLQKIKRRNLPKVRSKNEIVNKRKYDKDLNLVYSSESDLYDIDEINNYSMLEYEYDKKEEKEIESFNCNDNHKGRSRTHSFTILEMLQKKFDEE